MGEKGRARNILNFIYYFQPVKNIKSYRIHGRQEEQIVLWLESAEHIRANKGFRFAAIKRQLS